MSDDAGEQLGRELGTVRKRVLNLLARDEQFRNSDRLLYYAMLKETWDNEGFSKDYRAIRGFDGMFLEALYKLLKAAPDKSSIKRVRAHIQNKEEIYPATDPDVIRRRRQRSKGFQRYYSPGEAPQGYWDGQHGTFPEELEEDD